MNIKNYISFYRIFLDRIPYLVFHVTSKCNARCKHCFNWKNTEDKTREKKQLCLSEIEKISKNLGKIYFLTLSGGEPTLRDDLPQIISIFSKNNKPVFISISTNGYETKKITRIFKKILAQNPRTYFRINISIDGIYKDHDKIRGVRGIFTNTLQTIKILKTFKKDFKNFSLSTAMVLSYYNQHNFKKILDFTSKLGLDANGLAFVRGNPRATLSKKISTAQVKKAFSYMEDNFKFKNHPFSVLFKSMHKLLLNRIYSILLTNERNFKCYAAKKSVLIDDIGDVYPCEYLDLKLGNLREENYDMPKIIKSQRCKEIKRLIKKSNCVCTWECAIMSSFAFNIFEYPKILKKMLSDSIKNSNSFNERIY